uniref:Uncharacterized protein n=1 Tax=Aegilops tauschii subsp. strangulata TaxID=200361 RepID=A0A453D8B3_AEGTS
SLLAIPKVQPRFALAIWKKYSTMRSLLKVYMDPNKSVSASLLPCSKVQCNSFSLTVMPPCAHNSVYVTESREGAFASRPEVRRLPRRGKQKGGTSVF